MLKLTLRYWLFLFSVIILTLQGCKFIENEFVNDINDTIHIDITVDTDIFKFYSNEKNGFDKLVKEYEDVNNREKLFIDYEKKNIKYSLEPLDTFRFFPALSYRKDTLHIIKEIKFIRNTDTLVVDDQFDYYFMFLDQDKIFSFKFFNEIQDISSMKIDIKN